jgi:branched-chain amino acid transport system ATP-binding protein
VSIAETDTVKTVDVLAAVNLDAGYNNQPVIRNLNIEVKRGEVVALLGSNGAGKTTTLRALAGYLKPISGEVQLNGTAVTSAAHRRARRGLSYVTEERSIFSQLTGHENLSVARCDRSVVLELFPELGPLLGRRGGQLSGGEQQMLSVGRAIARRPNFLLADELSLGLAPLIVTRLLRAVRAAADERGVGALVVEQHVQQVLKVADRVYVLRRGEVVLSGTVAEVEPHIKDAYL